MSELTTKLCPCGSPLFVYHDQHSDYSSRWYWAARCDNSDCGWSFNGENTKEGTLKLINEAKLYPINAPEKVVAPCTH